MHLTRDKYSIFEAAKVVLTSPGPVAKNPQLGLHYVHQYFPGAYPIAAASISDLFTQDWSIEPIGWVSTTNLEIELDVAQKNYALRTKAREEIHKTVVAAERASGVGRERLAAESERLRAKHAEGKRALQVERKRLDGERAEAERLLRVERERLEGERAEAERVLRVEARGKLLALIEALLPKGIREARAKFITEVDQRVVSLDEFNEMVQAFVLGCIDRFLEEDFLSARSRFESLDDTRFLPLAEFDAKVCNLVQEWAKTTLDLNLDDEQAAAVAAVNGNVQVVARAGSGKTRVLVTRAIFLMKYCGVLPSEMLLLAFNRKAAQAIVERLKEVIDGALPHAMTFHALAYALVHPEEQIIFNEQDSDQLGLSAEIQTAIDEHIRSDEWGSKIREVMLGHFREDWELIVQKGLDLPMEDALRLKRSLISESLDGTYVKSFGEKLIANALFENEIDYKYERNHRWNGNNYRPDFTLLNENGHGGIVIEYFGMVGEKEYDERADEKRDYWATKPEWRFIELFPEQVRNLGAEGFAECLLQQLVGFGLTPRPVSEEEIWTLIQDRAIDTFTKTMTTVLGRCRKANLTPGQFEDKISEHFASTATELVFLYIAVSIYRRYLERLDENGQEDFDGLMWRAIDVLKSGETRFSRDGGRENGDLSALRFIMIDEYQDFSPAFAELIDGIRANNGGARVFCVGDDWQAINGFAGSDLIYFSSFAKHFPDSTTRHLRRNYRSGRSIVEVGNALMLGKGNPSLATKSSIGQVEVAWMNGLDPSEAEKEMHDGDEITPAVLRLVASALRSGDSTVMLSRRNGISWYVNYRNKSFRSSKLARFLDHIRSFFPDEDRHRIDISTTHKYKGLENSRVIILDALANSYPLIHPTWIFLKIFGESLDAIENAERRLLYVALTRAEKSLTLISENTNCSPFVADISGSPSLGVTKWAELPPVIHLGESKVEIRVYGAFEIKDSLKSKGYKFRSIEKCWSKLVHSEIFSIESLEEQEWTRSGCRVEVRDADSGVVIHEIGDR